MNMLLHQKGYLLILEEEIDRLAQEFEEYTIIRSIPGIGIKNHSYNHLIVQYPTSNI
ncbi:hypothetical protein [Bacillus sp. UMB0893]|uniref:hypothetical protein n=1 Tax=Bacillus sp. UMB0893 TaxID=2066053 RepID=UPI001C608586